MSHFEEEISYHIMNVESVLCVCDYKVAASVIIGVSHWMADDLNMCKDVNQYEKLRTLMVKKLHFIGMEHLLGDMNLFLKTLNRSVKDKKVNVLVFDFNVDSISSHDRLKLLNGLEMICHTNNLTLYTHLQTHNLN
jgi:hypothetical protein